LKFDNHIHWALGAWLGVAKLADREPDGLYAITSRGREVVAGPPPQIGHAYLLRFPEYAGKYGKGRSNTESPLEDTNESPVHT
jgi:hypothetical protein